MVERNKIGNEKTWEGRAWVSAYPSPLHDLQLPKVRMLTYRSNADFKSLFLDYTIHKNWEIKQTILFQEILSYQGDIYCLQDIDHYHDFWYPHFTSAGYSLIYQQRTQEKDYHTEGIAIAYKTHRFQLMKSIALELNRCHLKEGGGKELLTSFQEQCRTDDVGLILFLQPYLKEDLPTGLCIGCLMLDELLSNEEVRLFHCQYFLQQIEKENQSFQFPILLGINLNDLPLSLPYTFFKTGRKPLTASIPQACSHVCAYPVSRSTALVKWRAPITSIADPTILYYRICWRPGGSTILSFKSQIEVPSGDCIKYIEVMDEVTKKKKIVASKDLEFLINRLSAEIPYEFKVSAVNEMGVGEWSEPSEAIILINPERAPPMPAVIHFRSLQEVKELREEHYMQRADFNVHLAYVADPVNAETQLTPRLTDGSIDYRAEKAHILPSYANPRIGWNPSLDGQPTESLMKEMNRDYTIHTSLLRDKQGFKETSLNHYQDRSERSSFTQLNNDYEDPQSIPIHGQDGSTLLLDAKVVIPQIGRPNERQSTATSFRSAYEGFGVAGEPSFTSSYPSVKGNQVADTLDYLFYSNHSGVILHRLLTLPPYLHLKRGETPQENLSREDYTTIHPLECMKYNFNDRIDLLLKKMNPNRGDREEVDDDDDRSGVGSMNGGGGSEREKINQMKRNLKEIFAKQDELIPLLSSRSSSSFPLLSTSALVGAVASPPVAAVTETPTTFPLLASKSRRSMRAFDERNDEETDNSNAGMANQQSSPPQQQRMMSNIWGGRWASFTEQNLNRENYYLPNATYASSHLVMGAEYLFDSHQLNANIL